MRSVLLLALGVLGWPAVSFSSPPDPPDEPEPPVMPKWIETELALEWPASTDVNPWWCPGRGSKLRVDRLKVKRDAELGRPQAFFAADRRPVKAVDQVEVQLSFLNASATTCRAPETELFTERGLKTHERLRGFTGRTAMEVDSRRTGVEVVGGDVPVGTRAVWLTVQGSALRLRIDLEEGAATLVEQDGAVVGGTSGRQRTVTADPHPTYTRISVGERFPGATMVQAGAFDGCIRYYDLGVDDLYLVRNVERSGEVFDELVLDATFYRERDEPKSTPDCTRHVSISGRYAYAVLPGGFSRSGAEPDSRVTTFGTRQLRRFALEPGTTQLSLVFGDPAAPTDAMEIDLERGTVKVTKRSPAPRGPASRDLSREWLERANDPRTYLISKAVRGFEMRTDVDAGSLRNPAALCGRLRIALGKSYRPEGEAEPLRESFKVLCPQDGGR